MRGQEWDKPETRFTVTGELGIEVVVDNQTGLEWVGGDVSSMTWDDALDFCEGLDYAGHEDWRLPDFNQLSSLVDYELESPATEMPETSNAPHWSSTTRIEFPDQGEAIQFSYGSWTSGLKSGALFEVRCVRRP